MSGLKKMVCKKFHGLTQCWDNLINDLKVKKQNMLTGEQYKFSRINTSTAFELLEPRILMSAAAPVDSDNDGWYEITKAEHLVAIANSSDTMWMARSYIVMNDIDFYDMDGDGQSVVSNETEVDWNCDGIVGDEGDSAGFRPLGSLVGFSGIFDGNGYSIKNIWVNSASDSSGCVFSIISDEAIVKNIVVADSCVNGNYYTGGLVGSAYSNSMITNCHLNNVDVIGDNTGGLVGYLKDGTVYSSSFNDGKILSSSNSYYVGGIVGYCDNSNIILSKFNGIIETNSSYIGGIAGYSIFNSNISYVKSAGEIISTTENVSGFGLYIGGIVGTIVDDCVVQNSVSLIDISVSHNTFTSTSNTSIGGILGYWFYSTSGDSSCVVNSYAGGVVPAGENTYGVSGSNIIQNCLWSPVDTTMSIGGNSGCVVCNNDFYYESLSFDSSIYSWLVSDSNENQVLPVAGLTLTESDGINDTASVSGVFMSDVESTYDVLNDGVHRTFYGEFTVNNDGGFEYKVNESSIDYLTSTDSVKDFIIVSVENDGNVSNILISVKIMGCDDSYVNNNDSERIYYLPYNDDTPEVPERISGNIFTNDRYGQGVLVSSPTGYISGEYGVLNISADGEYFYSLDRSNEDVCSLSTSQELEDVFTITAGGKTQELKIVIKNSGNITDLISFPTWKQDHVYSTSTYYNVYNKYCPLVSGQRVLVGCVATALAQMVVYYEAPIIKEFSDMDYFSVNGTEYRYTDETAAMFNMPTASELTEKLRNINYDGIKSANSQVDYVNNDDVATLSLACGIIVHMNYGVSESNAIITTDVLKDAFGPLFYADFVYTEDAPTINFKLSPEEKQAIIASLDDGSPVYAGIFAADYSGHAMLITGYNIITDKFYCNMGWGGLQDGEYNYNNIDKYQYIEGFGINIQFPSANDAVATTVVQDTNTITSSLTDEYTVVTGNLLQNDIVSPVSSKCVMNSGIFYGDYGYLKTNTDGTYEYYLNNSESDVSSLYSDEALTEDFSYIMTDNTDMYSSQLVITISGAVIRPEICGDVNETIKQDYALAGELTALGTDSLGAAFTWSVSSNPTHGSIDIDQGGVYLYTPTAGWSGSDSFTVMVTGSDGGTVSQTISITVSSYVAPSSSVAGGFVYYSNMDGAADDPRSAVAVNKHAYTGVGDLSESIISSTNGITGVIVDIKGDGNYTLADFDIKVGTGGDVTGWQSYEAAGIGVPTITVKSGEGVGGSDRVLLTWDSSNAPKNTWLQVTAKTSAGISHNSSQIFGSIAGDIDESGSVNINDIITLLPMCNRILSNLTISNYDTNNSGSVNINDIISLLPLVNRPVALTAPDLSGMSMTQDGLFTELESAENLADDLNQIVYIDVDGERGFIFNSPIALSGITTDAFSLSGQFSGQEDSMLERVLDNLNSSDYALHGVEFTFDRPLSGDYSTIFVGGDDDTFEIFGDLYGISENVDTDNLVKNDNAIVFSDELGLEQYNDLETASSVLTEVIEHEVGHLLGLKHA